MLSETAYKLHSGYEGGRYYDVYRYWIPKSLVHNVNFLRKYFKILDRSDVPAKYRLRKNPIEFAEAAIMILGRIDQHCRLNRPFLAGSGFLSDEPWAVFGNASEEVQAGLYFRNMNDIAKHYESCFIDEEDACSVQFSFRLVPNLANRLADKYNCTAHYIMAIALLLMTDLILNCGPDTPEIFDIYTNDSRVDSHSINLDEWQNFRCKLLGSAGEIHVNPYILSLGSLNKYAIKPAKVVVDEVANLNDDLAFGEKTLPAVIQKIDYNMFYSMMDDDPNDTGCCERSSDVGSMYESNPDVQKKMEKYDHLGFFKPNTNIM